MRFDELREKRESILAIAARYHAGNVRVFGSIVRGDATTESDIDFLMDLRSRGFLAYMGLIQDLEDLLGHPVDVASEDQLHWVIRDRVLREAVPL